MDGSEVAKLLASVADSVDNDPGQFHFRIINAGAIGQGGSGGHGIVASATGGAPGSRTVGLEASGSGGDLIVEPEDVPKGLLADVSTELRSLAAAAKEEDKGAVQASLERLKQVAVVPAMITNLVTVSLGLAQLL
jgi:hypothetical protein